MAIKKFKDSEGEHPWRHIFVDVKNFPNRHEFYFSFSLWYNLKKRETNKVGVENFMQSKNTCRWHKGINIGTIFKFNHLFFFFKYSLISNLLN